MNVDDIGVADESLPDQNNDYDTTVNTDTVEKNYDEIIDDIGVSD